MGVERITIVINKLDAVNYDENIYNQIQSDLMETINRLGIEDYAFIPVSALAGDNVVDRSDVMSWYQGPTLLEFIQTWDSAEAKLTHPHMGVQMINRAENFRGVAGTVVGGSFNLGDDIVVLPMKKTAKISRIVTFDGDLKSAEDQSAVTLVLEPDVDATRGDMVELANNYVPPSDRFTANMVWLGEEDMIHSRSYYLISGSTQVPAIVTAIRHKLDINSGDKEPARVLHMNEIGQVEIATDAPIALDTYKNSRNTGNFILVDRKTMNTVGAGMVIHALRRSANVSEHHYEVDKSARAKQKAQKAKVLWFTGLSGSGKSTIANALEQQLFANGLHTYILDGDNLRIGLNKDLGFTKEDLAENVRRVSEVAKIMVDAGLIVLVALVSPFKEDRDQARTLFDDGEFVEVWVKTPVEVAQERDPKGLYKKAKSGELPNLTGVGQEYEPPTNAEIVLDGTADIQENVKKLIELVL
jgi:bifunctional enzyme CysN/CysC